MIKMLGSWEFGWNTPIKEADLWEYPMREFGVDEVWMAPISGIKNSYIKEVEDINQFIDECRKTLQIVFVDERGDTELNNFEHPDNVLYVFGKNCMSCLPLKQSGDLSVKIETNLKSGMLWSHQAASIIMYDRNKKWLFK